MKFPKLVRQVHFFGAGVADQVMLSGANFLAGFAMIRFTSDVDYGEFVLALSAVALVVSAQGAWLSGPLSTVLPAKSGGEKRLMVGALQSSQSRALRWVVLALLAIIGVGYVGRLLTGHSAVIGAATVLAGWGALQREYLRSVLLAYARPHSVLGADIAYVGVLIVGIAAAAFLVHPPGVYAVLTLAASAWAGMLVAYRIYGASPGWVSGRSRDFWRELRPMGIWATVGAVIYWLFAQSYNYVLAVRLDLSAVANVNAARLIIAPVFVFMIGINNLLMPLAASWLAKYGISRMLRGLALLALVITAFDLLYIGLAWVFRDWLITRVLHKTIPDQDRLVLLWSCMALIFLPREIVQSGLYAVRQIRSMAWMVAISAAVSLTIMWFGIERWGASVVLIGQLAGECVNLFGLSWLLWQQVRKLRRAD